TGQSPAKSDDVFAAALVAYEVLTGRHPYNRVPADKALDQGLEPEPVPFLKSRHWKALRKGLELRSEERTGTIEEFYQGLFSEDPPWFRYGFIGLVVIAFMVMGFFQLTQDSELDAQLASKQLLLKTNKERIEIRLRNVTPEDFKSRAWHNDLKLELNSIQDVNRELMTDFQVPADTLVATYEDAVVSTYTNQIQKLWDQANAMGTDEESVTQALALLREAQGYLLIVRENYSLESSLLRMQETSIDSGIQFRQLQLETIEQNKSAAERSLARQTAERQRNEIYGSNVAVLQNLLYECKQRKTVSDADLEKLKDALPALRSVDPVRYEKELPQMLASLAGCIKFLATDDPDRARQVKESVASMIDDTQAFSSLTIQDKDPCANRALVGNGKIGRICADKLVVGGKGPDLVVIPGSTQTGGKNYAITRTEIRVIDYNRYCEVSGCPPLPGATAYPVTRLTLQDARNYAAWLSAQTDRNYRLPGLKEWVHAASTDKKESLDDNINCTVVSRGVKRGENLVASLSGKPNGWGLYNYVGNAREWVLDGRNLLAVGGSHTDLKVDCRIDKSVEHSGEADAVTGFRLVRDI
ncbi:MAG: SUMF1/EgtB/PvdO family nonheme iron enzyme, partial [Gammaproteobacteria bacterium]|nr:SUMF1/EgtB/PvdO family nonheme iron enzyme [Gammaproteobacteria bacterium]